MLINLISEEIRNQPAPRRLNFSAKSIESLDQTSLEILGRIQSLRVLDLEDNQITQLPKDMSALKQLEELNLNGNPLSDMHAATDSIATMGHENLRNLYISLQEEDQVDYLLRRLYNIKNLNGVPVDRDVIYRKVAVHNDGIASQNAQSLENLQSYPLASEYEDFAKPFTSGQTRPRSKLEIGGRSDSTDQSRQVSTVKQVTVLHNKGKNGGVSFGALGSALSQHQLSKEHGSVRDAHKDDLLINDQSIQGLDTQQSNRSEEDFPEKMRSSKMLNMREHQNARDKLEPTPSQVYLSTEEAPQNQSSVMQTRNSRAHQESIAKQTFGQNQSSNINQESTLLEISQNMMLSSMTRKDETPCESDIKHKPNHLLSYQTDETKNPMVANNNLTSCIVSDRHPPINIQINSCVMPSSRDDVPYNQAHKKSGMQTGMDHRYSLPENTISESHQLNMIKKMKHVHHGSDADATLLSQAVTTKQCTNRQQTDFKERVGFGPQIDVRSSSQGTRQLGFYDSRLDSIKLSNLEGLQTSTQNQTPLLTDKAVNRPSHVFERIQNDDDENVNKAQVNSNYFVGSKFHNLHGSAEKENSRNHEHKQMDPPGFNLLADMHASSSMTVTLDQRATIEHSSFEGAVAEMQHRGYHQPMLSDSGYRYQNPHYSKPTGCAQSEAGMVKEEPQLNTICQSSQAQTVDRTFARHIKRESSMDATPGQIQMDKGKAGASKGPLSASGMGTEMQDEETYSRFQIEKESIYRMIQEGEHLMKEVTRDLDFQNSKEDNESSYVEMNHNSRVADDVRNLPFAPSTSYALSHVNSHEQIRVNHGVHSGYDNYQYQSQFGQKMNQKSQSSETHHARGTSQQMPHSSIREAQAEHTMHGISMSDGTKFYGLDVRSGSNANDRTGSENKVRQSSQISPAFDQMNEQPCQSSDNDVQSTPLRGSAMAQAFATNKERQKSGTPQPEIEYLTNQLMRPQQEGSEQVPRSVVKLSEFKNQMESEISQYDQVLMIYGQKALEPLALLPQLDLEETALNSTDLESIAIIFDKVRMLYKFREVIRLAHEGYILAHSANEIAQAQHTVDEQLAKNFDETLTQHMRQLNMKLDEAEDNVTMFSDKFRQTAILTQKFQMLNLCQQEAIQLLTLTSMPQFIERVTEVLDIVTACQRIITEKSLELNDQVFKDYGNELSEVKTELELADVEQRQMQLTLTQKEDQVTKLEARVRELEYLFYNNENKENIGSSEQNILSTLVHSMPPEVNTDADASKLGSNLMTQQIATKAEIVDAAQHKSNGSIIAANVSEILSPKVIDKSSFVLPPQSSYHTINSAALPSQGGHFDTNSSLKLIPLTQLKSIIQDIYNQKDKYDKRCLEFKLPFETMEQYLYTYLNQKYGLKSLIVEQATTIVTAVQTYLREDHDATLFAKTLKNECDEEFRFVQLHVSQTLLGTLRQVLCEKWPRASLKEVAAEVERIRTGTIEGWQWRKILQRMYDKADVQKLTKYFKGVIAQRKEDLLKDARSGSRGRRARSPADLGTQAFLKIQAQRTALAARANQGALVKPAEQRLTRKSSQGRALKPGQEMPRNSRSRGRLTREEESNERKKLQGKGDFSLVFSVEFEKGILDFQLEEHSRFLAEFNRLFKQVDADGDGVINEAEFRRLILNMRVVVQNEYSPDEDIDALLRIVDPNNIKTMTYSQVVQLLSNQLVPQSSQLMFTETDNDSSTRFAYQGNQNHNTISYNDVPDLVTGRQMGTAARTIEHDEPACGRFTDEMNSLSQKYNSQESRNGQMIGGNKLIPILEKFYTHTSSMKIKDDHHSEPPMTKSGQHSIQGNLSLPQTVTMKKDIENGDFGFVQIFQQDELSVCPEQKDLEYHRREVLRSLQRQFDRMSSGDASPTPPEVATQSSQQRMPQMANAHQNLVSVGQIDGIQELNKLQGNHFGQSAEYLGGGTQGTQKWSGKYDEMSDEILMPTLGPSSDLGTGHQQSSFFHASQGLRAAGSSEIATMQQMQHEAQDQPIKIYQNN